MTLEISLKDKAGCSREVLTFDVATLKKENPKTSDSNNNGFLVIFPFLLILQTSINK